MQQCKMNGDTFRRNDDGTLYINGNKVIKNKVSAVDKFGLVLAGFTLGSTFGTIVTLIIYKILFVK